MREMAMSNLEESKAKLDNLLDETGRYLCGRAKSMWYQNGEKNTKYFLNLERSRSKSTEMQGLKINGNIQVF